MTITFKTCIRPAEKRKDGTWRVKIRVTINRVPIYISTPYYVGRHQVSKRKYEIIDTSILSSAEEITAKYRDRITFLGAEVEYMTPQDIVKHIQIETSDDYAKGAIVVRDVFLRYSTKLINENRDKYASSIRDTLSSIDAFAPGITIDKITLSWLEEWQSHLISKGLRQTSTNLHIRNMRTVFNYARDIYNDDDKDIIRIPHYPFRRFRFRKEQPPKKRNLEADIIRMISDFPNTGQRRIDMARDVFILSFCLCGMNTADLYSCTDYADGRISYIRQKTRRKGEKARISVAIPPICEAISQKYLDAKGERVFDFHTRYSSADGFSGNVNKGLAYICETLGIPKVTTYHARHSFASIAHNKCGVNVEDISVCLTHSSAHDITYRYIAEDWSIVDSTQAKVIQCVWGDDSLVSKKLLFDVEKTADYREEE